MLLTVRCSLAFAPWLLVLSLATPILENDSETSSTAAAASSSSVSNGNVKPTRMPDPTAVVIRDGCRRHLEDNTVVMEHSAECLRKFPIDEPNFDGAFELHPDCSRWANGNLHSELLCHILVPQAWSRTQPEFAGWFNPWVKNEQPLEYTWSPETAPKPERLKSRLRTKSETPKSAESCDKEAHPCPEVEVDKQAGPSQPSPTPKCLQLITGDESNPKTSYKLRPECYDLDPKEKRRQIVQDLALLQPQIAATPEYADMLEARAAAGQNVAAVPVAPSFQGNETAANGLRSIDDYYEGVGLSDDGLTLRTFLDWGRRTHGVVINRNNTVLYTLRPVCNATTDSTTTSQSTETATSSSTDDAAGTSAPDDAAASSATAKDASNADESADKTKECVKIASHKDWHVHVCPTALRVYDDSGRQVYAFVPQCVQDADIAAAASLKSKTAAENTAESGTKAQIEALMVDL